VKNRKSTGIIASAVLAVLGMLLLFVFVKGKGDPAPAVPPDAAAAAAGTEPVVWVYKAKQEIPKGSPGLIAKPLLERVQVPRSQLLPGADADLEFFIDSIDSKITATPIFANQQVTNGMFESPEAAAAAALPPGQVAVTLILSGDRVAGIGKESDESVGIVASFANGESGAVTHLALQKIKIIGRPIPFGAPPASVAPGVADTGTSNFLGQVQVTLAVSAPDAERLIFMNQFGIVHLIKEPATAIEAGVKPIQLGNVYKPTNGSKAAVADEAAIEGEAVASTTKVAPTTKAAPAPTTAAAPAPSSAVPTTVVAKAAAGSAAGAVPVVPTTVP
jgi:pilus assembly protein CpaB